MRRAIVGFHTDDEGHWVADLECGHGQHVRHQPPWMERPWVTTPEGRRGRLGHALECLLCDEEAKPGGAMLIVHVHVHVKEDQVEAFRAASVANARQSRREPGIARFDVLQQNDDPTRFLLVEIYRTPDAPAAHKETAHYRTWAAAVADMMAEPRASVKFAQLDPDPDAIP